MDIRLKWNLLESRANALIGLGFDAARPKDVPHIVSELLPEAESCLSKIDEFFRTFEGQLDGGQAEELSDYLERAKDLLSDAREVKSSAKMNKWYQFRASLQALVSSMTYVVASGDPFRIRLTERALTHLQRMLVASASTISDWREAFQEREENCEELGGAHLLLHGIWAMKMSGKNAETDLVAAGGERTQPLEITTGEEVDSHTVDEVEQYVEAAVLTEWKRVVEVDEFDDKVEEAKKQAQIYGGGLLGGIEVSSVGYIVIVSEEEMQRTPKEIQGDNRRYRVVNIVIDPDYPSRRSK